MADDSKPEDQIYHNLRVPGGEIRTAWTASNPATAKVKIAAGVSSPATITENPDGTVDFTFTPWPGPTEAEEIGGSLEAIPLPEGIALFVGRIIIHATLLETAVKGVLANLCQANKTTLDWKHLSKYGKIVTRLQREAELLPGMPSVTKRIVDAAEATRDLHAKRGNIAHGKITLEVGKGDFRLVTESRHGVNKFTETELRGLALQMSRALFELTNALDPDDQSVQRPSQETRLLRDFLASNPHVARKHPTQPPRPQSSEA